MERNRCQDEPQKAQCRTEKTQRTFLTRLLEAVDFSSIQGRSDSLFEKNEKCKKNIYVQNWCTMTL
jgi:hypothetical protein